MRWGLKAFWTPVGAGVKTPEEVDALAIYLFGDSPQGRQAIRDIDRTVQEIAGLEKLTLLEDALDTALERTARTPGYAGVEALPLGGMEAATASVGEPNAYNGASPERSAGAAI